MDHLPEEEEAHLLWLQIIYIHVLTCIFHAEHFSFPPLTLFSQWVFARVHIRTAWRLLCSLPATITGDTNAQRRSLFCRNRRGGADYVIIMVGGQEVVQPTVKATETLKQYLTGGLILKSALYKFFWTTPKKVVLKVLADSPPMFRRQVLQAVNTGGEIQLPEGSLKVVLQQLSEDRSIGMIPYDDENYTRYYLAETGPPPPPPPVARVRPVVMSHGELDRNLSCLICLGEYTLREEAVGLGCFFDYGCSPFHLACLTQWLDQSGSCPKCRSQA